MFKKVWVAALAIGAAMGLCSIPAPAKTADHVTQGKNLKPGKTKAESRTKYSSKGKVTTAQQKRGAAKKRNHARNKAAHRG